MTHNKCNLGFKPIQPVVSDSAGGIEAYFGVVKYVTAQSCLLHFKQQANRVKRRTENKLDKDIF